MVKNPEPPRTPRTPRKRPRTDELLGVLDNVNSTDTLRGTAWGTAPELGDKKPMRNDVVAPKGYLRAGDVVIREIERVGKLENNVVTS